jgi:hypothetical protein
MESIINAPCNPPLPPLPAVEWTEPIADDAHFKEALRKLRATSPTNGPAFVSTGLTTDTIIRMLKRRERCGRISVRIQHHAPPSVGSPLLHAIFKAFSGPRYWTHVTDWDDPTVWSVDVVDKSVNDSFRWSVPSTSGFWREEIMGWTEFTNLIPGLDEDDEDFTHDQVSRADVGAPKKL